MDQPQNQKKSFRKKLLIYPKFQLSLLFLNLLVMLMTFGAIFGFVKRSFNLMIEEGLAANFPANHSYFQFVDYQSALVFKALLIALGIGFAVSTIVTLILSNKLAGPVVRLHSYFKQIASGQYPVPAVFFRKNDYFKSLPPLINKAMERLTGKETALETEKNKEKKIAA